VKVVPVGAMNIYNMQDINELITLIEMLRNRLADLVIIKGNLDDSEILRASQDLDDALDEYYKWFGY
jgi:hypothetical protein